MRFTSDSDEILLGPATYLPLRATAFVLGWRQRRYRTRERFLLALTGFRFRSQTHRVFSSLRALGLARWLPRLFRCLRNEDSAPGGNGGLFAEAELPVRATASSARLPSERPRRSFCAQLLPPPLLASSSRSCANLHFLRTCAALRDLGHLS